MGPLSVVLGSIHNLFGGVLQLVPLSLIRDIDVWHSRVAFSALPVGGFNLGLLNFFRPAPHIEPIADPEVVKKQYKYWRLRTFYSMYIGYVFFYFSRKSFTFAMPSMMQELGMTKAELGILASVLALTYGMSKFVSGIVSDRSNPRYIMAIGLILTGICNIFFGATSSLYLFVIFWGLTAGSKVGDGLLVRVF